MSINHPWEDGSESGAVLSECGGYRYVLWRRLPPTLIPTAMMPRWLGWLMLNPSTADASVNDATIDKIARFTLAFGYPQFMVVNMYALRSTDPAALKDAEHPEGPDNLEWVRRAASACDEMICAWGRNAAPDHVRRVLEVVAMEKCQKLKLNQDGSPAHPLYLPSLVRPTNYRPRWFPATRDAGRRK